MDAVNKNDIGFMLDSATGKHWVCLPAGVPAADACKACIDRWWDVARERDNILKRMKELEATASTAGSKGYDNTEYEILKETADILTADMVALEEAEAELKGGEKREEENSAIRWGLRKMRYGDGRRQPEIIEHLQTFSRGENGALVFERARSRGRVCNVRYWLVYEYIGTLLTDDVRQEYGGERCELLAMIEDNSDYYNAIDHSNGLCDPAPYECGLCAEAPSRIPDLEKTIKEEAERTLKNFLDRSLEADEMYRYRMDDDEIE
jgi:hypothetical protein